MPGCAITITSITAITASGRVWWQYVLLLTESELLPLHSLPTVSARTGWWNEGSRRGEKEDVDNGRWPWVDFLDYLRCSGTASRLADISGGLEVLRA